MTPKEAHAAAVEDAAGDAYRAMVYGADASLATGMAAAATRGTNAAITAYLAAMERQGFVMEPVEPTEEMASAGALAWEQAPAWGDPEDPTGRTMKDDAADMYRAMVAARPKVQP